MFKSIDPNIFVAPQIAVADVAEAAARGVTLIINNRPDGEAPDEPQGAEIEAATHEAGVAYLAIPVTHAGFSQKMVDAMARALEGADGPVLAYCRSGTRSTLLWALARAQLGDEASSLHARANAAGYDLGPVTALIENISHT